MNTINFEERIQKNGITAHSNVWHKWSMIKVEFSL
jgi:hypothetical protein